MFGEFFDNEFITFAAINVVDVFDEILQSFAFHVVFTIFQDFTDFLDALDIGLHYTEFPKNVLVGFVKSKGFNAVFVF